MRARAVAPWLQAALAASAALALADLGVRLQRAAATSSFLGSAGASTFDAIAAADRRVIAIGRADLLWLVVTGALFLVWTGLAYADLVRSGVRHQLPTALAVAAPLIPIASLVLVPRAMSDLARQGRFERTARVPWWFGLYLVAGGLRGVGLSLVGEGGLVDYQRSDRTLAAGDVFEIASAIVLVGLIGIVMGHAAARRREAAALAAADEAVDPDAMGRAIGWYRDPRRQAEVRWWDGTSWTAHVASTRQAPPPSARVDAAETAPVFGAEAMPSTAKACLFLGILAILVVFAPFSLGLGLWALRDLRRRPGAPGKGRAWFAVVMGSVFSIFLALAIIGALLGE
jgi:hypothetical protein